MASETLSSNNQNIQDLIQAFKNASSRKRRNLVPLIEKRTEELSEIAPSFISSFDREGDDWAPGFILQVLNRYQKNLLVNILKPYDGNWLLTPSAVGIDYLPLQEFLLEEKFEEADRFTSSKLRELAGTNAIDRGYVYFSEVQTISGIDLLTLDRLWVVYSQAKFGFSVQARILDSLGGLYEKLWSRIGWKNEGVWTRYPKSFNWSIDAPEGHMPLVNQLRGVRLMDSLLNHSSSFSRR